MSAVILFVIAVLLCSPFLRGDIGDVLGERPAVTRMIGKFSGNV